MGRKYRDHFGVGLMPKDGLAGTAGPMPYPVGVYDSQTEYVRTQKQAPVVLGSDGKYYLLEKFGITKGINPVSDNTDTWTMFDQFQYVFAEIILANFANLAGGIHYDNILMSQMGVKNGQASSNYQEYSGPTGPWQPNILLDWLTGLVKVKQLEAEGGKIGNLSIQDGKLKSSYSETKSVWNYSKFPPEYIGERTVNGEMMISVDAVELNETYINQGIPNTVKTSITPEGVNLESVIGLIHKTKTKLVDGRLSIEYTNTYTGVTTLIEVFSDGIYFNGQKFTGGDGGYVHPSSHPASMISTGTFPDVVKANNNTSYTTKQIRNIILSTDNAVSSQMGNGDIWIKYE